MIQIAVHVCRFYNRHNEYWVLNWPSAAFVAAGTISLVLLVTGAESVPLLISFKAVLVAHLVFVKVFGFRSGRLDLGTDLG